MHLLARAVLDLYGMDEEETVESEDADEQARKALEEMERDPSSGRKAEEQDRRRKDRID